MKIMFISDIHGASDDLEKVLECMENEGVDQLVILGDILNHGPRNPIPKGYNPPKVAALLNSIKEKILCVRGNCDSEVDQMLLEFPIQSDYAWLYVDGIRIFATHGHLWHRDHLPPLKTGDWFINGHYHIPLDQDQSGIRILNPGSISLPKENTPKSYAILENGIYTLKQLYTE